MARGIRVSVIDQTASDERDWWTRLDPQVRGQWHTIDVTDAAAVTSAIADANALSPLDGRATCAGAADRARVLHPEPERFAGTMTINVTGTMAPAQALVRILVDEGRPGSIVTLASTAGIGYVAGLGVGYHASKSAVVGLTRSMAGDLAQHGIR